MAIDSKQEILNFIDAELSGKTNLGEIHLVIDGRDIGPIKGLPKLPSPQLSVSDRYFSMSECQLGGAVFSAVVELKDAFLAYRTGANGVNSLFLHIRG